MDALFLRFTFFVGVLVLAAVAMLMGARVRRH
jgi:hypothetical protein